MKVDEQNLYPAGDVWLLEMNGVKILSCLELLTKSYLLLCDNPCVNMATIY